MNLAWVFFRAPTLTAAGTVLKAAFTGGFGDAFGWLAKGVLPSESAALGLLPGLGGRGELICMALVFAAALMAAVKPGNTMGRMETFRPTAARCALCCGLLAWAALSFSGVTAFIYANF